jgi:transposase InsO family protein
MSQNSISGARYFVTFIDDKTRMTFTYPMKSKDETYQKFKFFKTLVENQTEKKIKILRSDNGGEYTSHEFDSYLKEHGIKHQKSAPYVPEQNGIAERANRTIVERARCMLHEQNVDLGLWAEAISTSTYLKN